jgi:hypothetical protein
VREVEFCRLDHRLRAKDQEAQPWRTRDIIYRKGRWLGGTSPKLQIVSESLVRDVYPADVVEVGGRVWSKCRAFVTTERLVVWKRDKRGVLDKVVDVVLGEPGAITASASNDLPTVLEIKTLTRGYLVNKGAGCRCRGGSLLALAPPASWPESLVR